MFVTIFTPTYNRSHLLTRLLDSLYRQSQKNFEWLVVDDGSTDDTELFFSELMSKPQPFVIRYTKQKNGGKHRAVNNGVKIAQGDLFFIVDSDDYLTDDAVEKVCIWEKSLDKSHKWAGVAGLKGYSESEPIGQIGKNKLFTDAKHSDLKKKHLIGDKAQIYYTDLLKKFPFPEIENEKFITEETVWNAIARNGYFIRWFPAIICVCEYRSDGLTLNLENLNKRNSKGLCLWAKGQLATYPYNIVERMLAIRCYHLAVRGNLSNRRISEDLGISNFFLYITILTANIFSAIKRIFLK